MAFYGLDEPVEFSISWTISEPNDFLRQLRSFECLVDVVAIECAKRYKTINIDINPGFAKFKLSDLKGAIVAKAKFSPN